jgi:ABC-2 type transport system permease protein
MRILFKRELRLNLVGFLVCTVICSALSIYVITITTSIGPDIKAIIDMKMPQQIQLAFGMAGLDFSSRMGTFALIFSYLYLTYGIYSASLFARIVSKEFTEKTAEFLFSLPAKRIHLILIKLGTAMFYLTAVILTGFLVAWMGFAVIIQAPYKLSTLLQMAVAYWLGAMFFGSLSYMLSSYYIRARLAAGLVLGAYLLQLVTSLKAELEPLKYLSPFDWFKGSNIVNRGGLEVDYALVAVVGIMVCLIVGTRRFMRKDVLV